MGDAMRVSVIGAGKMGLPLACVFASRGASVLVADCDSERVSNINDGVCPFEEPGLEKLMREMVENGRLRAVTDNGDAITVSEVVVIIVPVKLMEGGRTPDTSIIESVTNDVARSLAPGGLVSYETSLPVGFTRELGELIQSSVSDFDLVFSPERVKSRQVLDRLARTPKIVGGVSERSARRGVAFYERYLGAPVINVGTLEAAEFVKLAGMLYRDVNIALANELARFAEATSFDFSVIREAANTDGECQMLVHGIGVGGHCTPVYPYFLIDGAHRRGVGATLAESARMINESQPAYTLGRVGDLSGQQVLILGLSFRPGVKEASYSPAFGLADEVKRLGGRVEVHDPLFSDDEIRSLGLEPGRIGGQHVLVLNTAHEQYRDLDFHDLAVTGVKVVVDGRNLWEGEDIRSAGIRYLGVGGPDMSPDPLAAPAEADPAG